MIDEKDLEILAQDWCEYKYKPDLNTHLMNRLLTRIDWDGKRLVGSDFGDILESSVLDFMNQAFCAGYRAGVKNRDAETTKD